MKIKSSLKKAHWPWPKMDIPEVAKQAGDNNLYMPNIGFLKIDIGNEWKTELGNAANSKRLWINSLVSAHACLEYGIKISEKSEEYFTIGANIVKSYIENYNSDRGVFQDAWRDEHAVANRLFVLTAFIHYASDSAEPVSEIYLSALNKYISIEKIFSHALIHAEWLNNDLYYVKNNHGVMMDIALAQFSLILGSIDNFLAERYLKTIRRRLEMMLDLTFDKDGCCTENSPTYHFVNYSLYSAALNFLTEYNLIENIKKWQDKLNKVRGVGNLFLRSDKTIPLIGDSESVLGTFFPQADVVDHRYGLGYYNDAGFFVISQPDWHMTFKVGGSSYSHRHIDDLSLTLQYRGKDFFVDCGMYNYDIKDKLRRWFISSRAHSGIYVDSMGDVRFANFTSPKEMSRFVSIEMKEMKYQVHGVHNLSKEVEINRLIMGSNEGIKIKDFFESSSEQRWRIQFNLHPLVEIIKIDADSVYALKHGETYLKIALDSNYETKIESINYSPRFMVLEKSQAIVIQGISKKIEITTEIEFKKP